jgi:hypothetical protein
MRDPARDAGETHAFGINHLPRGCATKEEIADKPDPIFASHAPDPEKIGAIAAAKRKDERSV